MTKNTSQYRRLVPTLGIIFTGLIAVLLFGPLVQASEDEDDDGMSYEEIVQTLQAPKATNHSRSRFQRPSGSDSFENILIHGGVGYATTLSRLQFADGNSTLVNQRGIEATLGIDLFSDNWMAEGAAHNFGITNYGNVDVGIKDFDLKIIYHNRIAPKIGVHIGGGLAARYMVISRASDVLVAQKPVGLGTTPPPEYRRVVSTENYTTPSSLAVAGLDIFFSDGISFGAQVSYRSALINETLDESSWDAGVRVDAHF